MLRLNIMCKGDMTLIPTKASDGRPDGPVEAVFETTYSCRNFSAIKAWSIERDSAGANYRANAEELKQKIGML